MAWTIESLHEAYRAQRVSPREVWDETRVRIKKRNPLINAFLRPDEFEKPRESELVFDEQRPLSAIPGAIKDNILIQDRISTAGSRILEHYSSGYDATVVRHLDAAGAMIVGKTNMDEFAMGSSTENSAYGPTLNPVDTGRVPGGSSGGSAAAVADDQAVFALGSDTGGSIREPAAFCGIVGLKPTYGRVSRHGLIAMASSLDQVGPLTRTVRDAAIVLRAIAGRDHYDATTVPVPVPDYLEHIEAGMKGLVVGVPKEFFGEGLTPEVRERVEATIAHLQSAGATIKHISLPYSPYALAAYYVIAPSEISANLSRFDGIRYGYRSEKPGTIFDTYLDSRAEALGPEPKRRIMIGAYALSAGYFDAYYLKAQKVRRRVQDDYTQAFKDVDVIVGPTTPTVAFKLGEKTNDPLGMYLLDIYTVPVNLAGLPAISVPCGMGRESNLPVGFQIIGRAFDEVTILRVARSVEHSIAHE